jgi:hypothetical protein
MTEVHGGVIQNVIVVVFHVIETWTGIATGVLLLLLLLILQYAA